MFDTETIYDFNLFIRGIVEAFVANVLVDLLDLLL